MRRELSARTAGFLWVSAPPRAVEPLLALLHETFRAFDEEPARMVISADEVKTTTFNAARLAKAFRAASTLNVTLKSEGEELLVTFKLRDDARYDERLLEHRYVELVTPLVAPDDMRLHSFLEAACTAYPVVHGGVIRASSPYYAGAESVLVGAGQIDVDTQKRIHFDAMNHHEGQRKLRRLYPVTIIGPAIWATLPPLPAVEPPLVVRDLADCKMVTAWPTLVDPHDLQFLLGTRELRRWLWPHTIQNPADDPDEIDRRLRWAELLPW